MPVSQADIDLAQRLADAAGAAIRPYFRADHGLEAKDDSSPVTLADKAAEAAMRRLIIAERPMDAIIGEEEAARDGTSGRTWVLDPIDGTRSFIVGRPIFGTLIALLEDGWPVLGIIDQPIIAERWLGVTGRTTLFNGQPAETRACRELSKALLATTSPALFTDDQLHAFEHVDSAVLSTVLGGDCYNYGLVASGHLDLVIEAGLKPCDILPLVPIIEAAGGVVTTWQGRPVTEGGSALAAGDPRLHEAALALLGA